MTPKWTLTLLGGPILLTHRSSRGWYDEQIHGILAVANTWPLISGSHMTRIEQKSFCLNLAKTGTNWFVKASTASL